MPVPTWIVQYHFASDPSSPAAEVRLVRIEADSEAEARRIAVASAPSGEFIMTVVSESDEQLLGTVKHRARWLAGQGTRSITGSSDKR